MSHIAPLFTDAKVGYFSELTKFYDFFCRNLNREITGATASKFRDKKSQLFGQLTEKAYLCAIIFGLTAPGTPAAQ